MKATFNEKCLLILIADATLCGAILICELYHVIVSVGGPITASYFAFSPFQARPVTLLSWLIRIRSFPKRHKAKTLEQPHQLLSSPRVFGTLCSQTSTKIYYCAPVYLALASPSTLDPSLAFSRHIFILCQSSRASRVSPASQLDTTRALPSLLYQPRSRPSHTSCLSRSHSTLRLRRR